MPRLGHRSRLAGVALMACVIALSACAPLSSRQESSAAGLAGALSSFDASGRLSARHGGDAFAASFHWRHSVDRDDLEFSSPLGQVIARLSGDATAVELTTADGKVVSADNWPALTARGLGWPLPVEGLTYWIQGVPRNGAAFELERDARGLPDVMRQDGWTIAYQSFVPGQDALQRPARLTLSYPEVELRLVIDAWQ
jgi:outer membrane lipoprotein LolB